MRSESRARRRLHNRARRDKLSDFSIHGRTSSSWPYRLRSVAHLRNSVEPAIANADLSAPCRHGKRFGFAFRVKYCSRTSPSHGRYVVLARAANDHEWSKESYQHFHVSILRTYLFSYA